jgi:hypothetical protein
MSDWYFLRTSSPLEQLAWLRLPSLVEGGIVWCFQHSRSAENEYGTHVHHHGGKATSLLGPKGNVGPGLSMALYIYALPLVLIRKAGGRHG